MNRSASVNTEVIVFCSGKGGTGKTSLIAALAYALNYSGHRVLMVDADRATDGFSLFVLGPQGMRQIDAFEQASTFGGILSHFEQTGQMEVKPHAVHRLGPGEHNLSYDAIISGKGLYGDEGEASENAPTDWNRQYARPVFQAAIQQLFSAIRDLNLYDYVLVDSRGGFSFESTDVAAAADSFVVVTEATHTNFYQDRNLVDRINAAAAQMSTRSLLRGIIVNKSTDPPENSFRNELVREFGVRMEDTFPVQLDVKAAQAYKTQKAIYLEAPESPFAFDSLQAFQQILRVVTSQWSEERARKWNQLVATIDTAIGRHNAGVEAEKKRIEEEQVAAVRAHADLEKLRQELEHLRGASEQEKRRQDILLEELKAQAAQRSQSSEREREIAEARLADYRDKMAAELADLRSRLVQAESASSEQTAHIRMLEREKVALDRGALEIRYQAMADVTKARSSTYLVLTGAFAAVCVVAAVAVYLWRSPVRATAGVEYLPAAVSAAPAASTSAASNAWSAPPTAAPASKPQRYDKTP